MHPTFGVRQNMKRFVAVARISLTFIVAQSAPALAATYSDRDDLTNELVAT